MTHPEVIVANARIATGDVRRPWATALAIFDGKLAALGSAAEILKTASPATTVLDAGGAAVELPPGAAIGVRLLVCTGPSGSITLASDQ